MEFLDSISDTQKWDTSLNKDGSVMAYYQRNGSYYDITICGYGEIAFPEDSSNLFYGYQNLTIIEFLYGNDKRVVVNTSNVTSTTIKI